MKIRFWKLLIALAATVYFSVAWLTPGKWRFLDYVNLVIHEAGHALLSPFGVPLSVIAGTLFQIATPLLFFVYFLRTRQKFSSGLTLFWLSQSLWNVSVYAGDALRQTLPLLGGEGTIHDWNWILSTYGGLRHAAGIGEAIHIMSLFALIVGAIMSIKFSYEKNEAIHGGSPTV